MALRNEIFVDQDKMYALTSDDTGQLYLEVVCGGVAMENVVVALNSEEKQRYQSSGKDFLDEMAVRIQHSREQYAGRIVQ